jgi:hypothetical protein
MRRNCELFCGESYTEDTSCLKLVSGNRSLLNSFLLINTHERFEILTAVKMTMLLLFSAVPFNNDNTVKISCLCCSVMSNADDNHFYCEP